VPGAVLSFDHLAHSAVFFAFKTHRHHTTMERITGELPITLTRPNRSVIQQQKHPFQLLVLRSIVLCWNVSIDRGVPTPLSIQFVYPPMMERTFVELFDCSIRSDRLTGSSQLHRVKLLPKPPLELVRLIATTALPKHCWKRIFGWRVETVGLNFLVLFPLFSVSVFRSLIVVTCPFPVVLPTRRCI
jgi:hypothetical protein